MKKIIILGSMALAMGLFTVSCNDDDDASPATGEIISSVQTSSSEVTSTSAILSGTVESLGNQKAYTAGFYYGSSEDNLSETITGTVDGNTITAEIKGLQNGQTVYYQAFITLQGKVTYTGEIKSLTTSDASITTGDAAEVDHSSVQLKGTAQGLSSDVICGFMLASSEDKIKNGLAVKGQNEGGNITLSKSGLIPNTTYYYAAYMDLGNDKDTLFGEVKSFKTEEYKITSKDYVDLGLSVRWFSHNVGAKTATELGALFTYGDIAGCTNSVIIDDYTNQTDISGTEYDVATAAYGEDVQMPTQEQIDELISLCQQKWETQDGVYGVTFTGPNGKSIFLPAAGFRIGNNISNENEQGWYYSGQISNDAQFAQAMVFTSSSTAITVAPLLKALAIRPVYTAEITDMPMTITGGIDNWGGTIVYPVDGVYTMEYDVTDFGVVCFDWIGEGADYAASADITLSIDGKEVKIDQSKVLTGDIENKGNYRIELYNSWGNTKDNPPVNVEDLKEGHWKITIKTHKPQPMAITSGIDGWANTTVYQQNGTYTYEADVEKHDNVICFDFIGAGADYAHGADITLSIDGEDVEINQSKVLTGDIENKGNYRIELYNSWGNTQDNPPVDIEELKAGKWIVTIKLK